MVKHFFRALAVFLFIIILGIAGVVLVNYLEQKGTQAASTSSSVQVAK
jgi:uncharacterized iron-regulated membrane protein